MISDPGQYYETHYKSLYNYYTNGKGMSAYAAHVAANNAIGGSSEKGGLGYICYNVPEGQYLIGDNGKLNPNATLGNKSLITERTIRLVRTTGSRRLTETPSDRSII